MFTSASNGPAAGLMALYGPVQLSSCNGSSPGMPSVLFAGKHSKPSCDPSYGCAILELLDYLGCRDCLMLPEVTRTLAEHQTREESARNDKGRQLYLAISLKKTKQKRKKTFAWGFLAFASPLHLLSLLFATKQVKLICNDLCYIHWSKLCMHSEKQKSMWAML